MTRLDVWLALPSGERLKAGVLINGVPDPVRAGLQGQFLYEPDYLDNPQAFLLDPLHLSMSIETFNADLAKFAGVRDRFDVVSLEAAVMELSIISPAIYSAVIVIFTLKLPGIMTI